MKLNLYFYCLAYCFYLHTVCAQRAPPGVNPHHYQQQGYQDYQVNPQHMQQQQIHMQQQQGMQHGQAPVQQGHQQMHQQASMQHQQVPVQQQQVPMQQQQVPMQQVPVQQQQIPMQQQQVPMQQQVPVQQQQGHHGHHGHEKAQLLNTANMEHEKEHIQEHLDVPVDTSKMTEQELQFHYFKMHDADNNNKLDGCELIKSLIHWHEQGSHDKQGTVESKIFKDEDLVALIDPILNVDDTNKDGYIDYPEFVRAQQKAAAAQNQNRPT